jgi:hypothetical protein
MSDKDIFVEREHWLEEEYFRKKNQELIEKMHERKAREEDLRRMSEVTGINDQDVLEALQGLGFTADTVLLLYIVPLVEVAWAEGGVADRERDLIFKFAQSRGVEPGGAAHQKLSQWLEEKPSERFFENALHAIRVVLELLPAEQREASRRDLIAYCSHIAAVVSGGILGPGQITDEERMLIAHIATEIGQGREETIRKVIGR